jgi:hydroxyacylglutathione hydrolase
MILKRFYDDRLAQASYMVACSRSREALVVDPARDVEPYLEAAKAEGLRITHVTDTHVHADFVSGARELAARTGARVLLSAEGDPRFGYTYIGEDGAEGLRDGDSFAVGSSVRIGVMHTPGHTPEHLTFLVTDTDVADRPMGAFTGDFVFVGDVGRPDLLEKAVRVEGSAETAARDLFRSIARFRELPDYLQLWPGHGAGSACGKALGAVPQTTLGYEKLFNRAFAVADEDAFVAMILAGQPEPPRYFAEVKQINRAGAPLLGGYRRPAREADERLGALLAEGAVVVDTRPAADFAAGHVPGTLNVPLNRVFSTWAGWLLAYDRPFHLLVDEARVDEAVRALQAIGLDGVGGWMETGAVAAWAAAGGTLDTVPQIGARELAERMGRGEVNVLDVRGRAEWEAGHLPGVRNLPVGYLADHLDEIPAGRPLVVQCQGGARSAIAASVLRAHGVPGVVNMSGGFQEWAAAGLPVEREEVLEEAGV